MLRQQPTNLCEGFRVSSWVDLRYLLRWQHKRLKDDLGDLAGIIRDVRTFMVYP